ncbi:HAUS1 protein, partial [Rynchops niger]|nr:HAUS1 protein [Rynchops niger]
QIALWLKKIYKQQPVPVFEVNKRTVDILYHLAKCNEASNMDVSLLIEDMMQKATEYEAEVDFLYDVQELSSYSSSPEMEGFFFAINDMTSELYATEAKNRKMELELRNVRKNLTGALMLEKEIWEDLEKTEKYLELEEAKAEYQSQKTKFLEDKSKDFTARIKAAEDQLTATGLQKSLTHGSLVNLSE